jgi:hypothetical protein
MTSPGGNEIHVDPGVMHNIAGSLEARSADFKPDPPYAGDGTFTSQQSAQAYNDAMAALNAFAAQHHMTKAEALRLYTSMTQAKDEENGALLSSVAPGGGKGEVAAAKGLDVAQMTNAIFGPLAQMASGLEQGLNQLMSGTEQSVGTVVGNLGGQAFSGAANMVQGLGKSSVDQMVKANGGGDVAAGAEKGGAETKPAGAVDAPGQAAPLGSGPGVGARGDNTHPQDHDDNRVVPAGSPMPLGSGMGGMGAHGGSSSTERAPVTKRIVAPGMPVEQEEEDTSTQPIPIPVMAEPLPIKESA